MPMAKKPPDSQERENPEQRQLDGVLGGIEELPKRVTRYGKAKQDSLDVAQYIAQLPSSQGMQKRLHRLQTCGDYLIFRHFYTVDKVRLHAASLCCQHLLCPLCAIRRGSKALAKYLQRWEFLKESHPSLNAYLVTLTVKDGQDLKERYQHLYKSQRELWKRKQRGRGSVLDGVAGAVWSYEVKRGKNSGQWHPHIHMIALAETPPDQQQLSSEWENITGDSKIVDVRPISQADPASGFVEVFKYAVKFSEQPPADTVHAFQTLRSKRLMDCSGLFRGVVVPDDLMDEAEGLHDLPYVELFYRYLKGGYSLTKRSEGKPEPRPLPKPKKPPVSPFDEHAAYLSAETHRLIEHRLTVLRL
jgi:hypothetical protein